MISLPDTIHGKRKHGGCGFLPVIAPLIGTRNPAGAVSGYDRSSHLISSHLQSHLLWLEEIERELTESARAREAVEGEKGHY